MVILPINSSKGLHALHEFMKARKLSVAGLHQGLVDRFGDKVKYSRVLSWVSGARRLPDEEAREWLWLSCGISPDDWLSAEEIKQKKWRAEQKAPRRSGQSGQSGQSGHGKSSKTADPPDSPRLPEF